VHGGAWFAVAVLSALVLGSALLYTQPFVTSWPQGRSVMLDRPFWAGLPEEQRSAAASYAYWFVVTPLAFAIMAFWYWQRERRLGIRVRWRWIVAIGGGVLVLLAVLAAVPVEQGLAPDQVGHPSMALSWRSVLTPLLAVAAAVLAVGFVERSWWLGVAGGWLAAITLWQCTQGMGGLPGWATWVLTWGVGTAGGQLTLLGLHRPGPVLIVAVLPMIGYMVSHAIQAWRSRS
jgi:hypothetical protein